MIKTIITKLLMLFGVSIFGGLLLSVVFAQEITPASKRLTTTSPAFAPLTKNIFFPSGSFASRGKYGMLEGEFVLSATVISDTKRQALLSYPVSKTTRWIKQGDIVGEMLVRKITSSEIEVERFGRSMVLAIGSGSSSLTSDKRIFSDSFQLVGVCITERIKFAVIKPANEEIVYQIHVEDFIGSGWVSAVDHDSIILIYAGREYNVPVGGRFTPEGKVQ